MKKKCQQEKNVNINNKKIDMDILFKNLLHLKSKNFQMRKLFQLNCASYLNFNKERY